MILGIPSSRGDKSKITSQTGRCQARRIPDRTVCLILRPEQAGVPARVPQASRPDVWSVVGDWWLDFFARNPEVKSGIYN